MQKTEKYMIDGISLSIEQGESDVLETARKRLTRAGVAPKDIRLFVFRRSVDARKRSDIKLVWSVLAEVHNAQRYRRELERINARRVESEQIQIEHGHAEMSAPPLVVGMGPAGMFCALILAEQGYSPILIDRGDCVRDRVRSVQRFYSDALLDADSNIQFGAGGAGTFSDGKLLTRINDPKCSYVLETLRRFGAPDDITLKAKPHIGTDILRTVVDNILSHIEALGGKLIYRCRMTDIEETAEGIRVFTTKGDFLCGDLVLALGHSARDTYRMLIEKGFCISPKPISVGVRIEHLRSDIENALYGDYAGHPALGAAEYALSDTRRERGVYTFCMCPGGEVVAAASEEGGVVVNGMSSYARDGANSNSAVLVSVRPNDFESFDGCAALGAIEFQRRIERAAFQQGGGDYHAPMQTVGDLMSDKCGSMPTRVMPTYMGGKCRPEDMKSVLPEFAIEHLKYAISTFDRKISGFADESALLTGAETRTSAPVRIQRGEEMNALGHEHIYPCGEGAGYAGGITSAAVDGIKCALAIMKRYKKIK